MPEAPKKPAVVVSKPGVKVAAPGSKSLVKADAALFGELSQTLSLLGGKLDKDKNVIRPPAPVMIAGTPDGGVSIRLPGVFSTRCETLDAAIGRGGIPMARITTIAGGEAGGKTTIALHTCAEAQAMGGVAIFIDNEHKLDLDYAKALGVDLTKLLITQPGTIEDAFNIYNETVLWVHAKNPNIPVFGVLDSINASKSEHEYEEDGSADFTESNSAGLGVQARIMSDRLPKIARLLANRRAALLMISQPRDQIGGYGGQNLIAGGRAPKFYSAVIIELIRKGFFKEGEKNVGSEMIAKIVKNQVSPPFKEGKFIVRWGSGVDYNASLLERAKDLNIIQVGANAWFEMDDPSDADKKLKWQGPRGFHSKIVTDRPDVFKAIKALVRKRYEPTVMG